MELELEKELEEKYANWEEIPYLTRVLKEEPGLKAFIEEEFEKPDVVFKFLVQLMLHKRMNIPTAVGMFRKYFDNCKDCFNYLMLIVEAELCFYKNKQFITKAVIPDAVQEQLDRFMFPMPMVIRPLKVRSNLDTGYLFSKKSIVLKDNYTDQDVCLDVINKLNQISLTTDYDLAVTIKNEWKDIDHKKADETEADYEKRVTAFKKYNKATMFVLEMLKEKKIYLCHAYDKRGRVYCRGYHINYQGNSWNKAVILLNKGEKVL